MKDAKPVLWDVFSGTGSILKAARLRKWETHGFELESRLAKRSRSVCCDVLKHDFSVYKKPHVIWASIPCTANSIATKKADRERLRDYTTALKRVRSS